jgi:predicted membrane metal-binding protein
VWCTCAVPSAPRCQCVGSVFRNARRLRLSSCLVSRVCVCGFPVSVSRFLCFFLRSITRPRRVSHRVLSEGNPGKGEMRSSLRAHRGARLRYTTYRYEAKAKEAKVAKGQREKEEGENRKGGRRASCMGAGAFAFACYFAPHGTNGIFWRAN